jgi:formylglycine-generating enzyme required for sulfatase activity
MRLTYKLNSAFIFAFFLTNIGFSQTSTTAFPEKTIPIPGTNVAFKIKQLPAANFEMGSASTETGRKEDEGQHNVQLDSFWIGVYEVTFDEFYFFQYKNNDSDSSIAETPYKADAIARPSPPYFDFTYGRGKQGGFPASTMTQQSAMRYCQWLSDKTGDLYRLPTEAEWEYAARANTKTMFSWGDDPALASEFAWFFDNSNGSYQKIGTKKPNPWGLYDMHGNVAEWTLDYYVADYFQRLDTASINPMIAPIKKHSRTVRGGSFEDYTSDLRCANRKKSEPKWQMRDPQIPKSRWWNPDSPFLGFRLVKENGKRTKAERDAFFAKYIKD